jgi:hypothetical protein
LRAGDEIAAVDDDRGHTVDAARAPEMLGLTNIVGVAIRRQNVACGGAIEAGLFRCRDKHLMIRRAPAVGEVGLEQRVLQRLLLAFQSRPVEQAVRIERVIHPALVGHRHGETERGGALSDHLAIGGELLGRRAIFAGDMLDHILALGRHVGIELERLEMQRGFDLVTSACQRLFQAVQADDAPGAGNVRDEIDLERAGHRPVLSCGYRVDMGQVRTNCIRDLAPHERPWWAMTGSNRRHSRCKRASTQQNAHPSVN